MRAILLVLPPLALAGCGGGGATGPPPTTTVPTASGVVAAAPGSVAERARATAGALGAATLEGAARLTVCVAASECHVYEARVVVARSGAAAIRSPGAFELVSDGRHVRVREEGAGEPTSHDALDLPVARADSPWLALSPLDLSAALLPPPPGRGEGGALIDESRPGEHALLRATRVGVGRLRSVRRWVFDGTGERLLRIESFDSASRLRTVATYAGWDPRHGAPHSVTVSWPAEGIRLVVEAASWSVDSRLGRDAYRLSE